MKQITNTLKTITLLGTLTALLSALGYFLGGWQLGLGFLGFGIITNLITFWFSDKIALLMTGAREIEPTQAPELAKDVAELAAGLSIPAPRIFISPGLQPNAFATGRGPANGAVCFTEGILKLLSRDELRGVIAHELAHIAHRDVLTSTIAAVIASAVSSVANFAYFFSSSDDDGPSPLVTIALVILAPIAATLVQLAISRTREYAADSAAAQVTKNPQGLADALVKIHSWVERQPLQVNPALASLYIANPLHAGIIAELFSTHPPLEKRLANLNS